MTVLERFSPDEIRKMVATHLSVDPSALSMQYRTLVLDVEEIFADDASESVSAYGSHSRAIVPICFSVVNRDMNNGVALPSITIDSFECALYSCYKTQIPLVDSNTVFGLNPQIAINSGSFVVLGDDYKFGQAPFLIVDGDVQPRISLDGLKGRTNIEVKFIYLEFGLS